MMTVDPQNSSLRTPWFAHSDARSPESMIGCAAGAGMGIWAAVSHAVEVTESTDLIAIAGAAVGLLAVALAAIALLMGFLTDRTADLISAAPGGVRGFFRPFQIVATVSAFAAIAAVAGAIDASSPNGRNNAVSPGPTWLASTLYGVAVWFFVWAVVGAVQLVRIFIQYGEVQATTRRWSNPPTDAHNVS